MFFYNEWARVLPESVLNKYVRFSNNSARNFGFLSIKPLTGIKVDHTT